VAVLAGLAHLAVAAHLAQPLVLPVRAHLVLRAWPQVVAVPVVRAGLVLLVLPVWLQVRAVLVVRAHLLVPAHRVRVVVVLAELAVEAVHQVTADGGVGGVVDLVDQLVGVFLQVVQLVHVGRVDDELVAFGAEHALGIGEVVAMELADDVVAPV